MGIERAEHVIAIDGGGTGCRVAIATSNGVVMSRASGGASNVTTDRLGAIGSVLAALRDAAASAGLSPDDLTRAVAHVGLAGVLTDDDSRAVARALPFADCAVTDDRPTSVAGALGGQNGALIAAGTGTFVAAQHEGAMRCLGGWGLQIGDQASGAWLGRALLEQCLLCQDGLADHSPLTRATLAQHGGASSDLVRFATQATPKDYATHAPQIVEAATHHDVHGVALLQRAVGYLDQCLRALDVDGQDVICLGGGLGPHLAPFLSPDDRARIQPAKGTALDGALYLARQRVISTEGRG